MRGRQLQRQRQKVLCGACPIALGGFQQFLVRLGIWQAKRVKIIIATIDTGKTSYATSQPL